MQPGVPGLHFRHSPGNKTHMPPSGGNPQKVGYQGYVKFYIHLNFSVFLVYFYCLLFNPSCPSINHFFAITITLTLCIFIWFVFDFSHYFYIYFLSIKHDICIWQMSYLIVAACHTCTYTSRLGSSFHSFVYNHYNIIEI